MKPLPETARKGRLCFLRCSAGTPRLAHMLMCARPREVRGNRATSERHPKLYLVFSSDESRGLRSIQSTTLTRAYANLLSGIWVERYDEDGCFLGFQIRSSQELTEDLESRPTSVMITARDSVRNVTGVSRTADLTEEQRLNRDKLPNGRKLPPEDGIERLKAKIEAFTRPASRMSTVPGAPYGDRAARVYPNG